MNERLAALLEDPATSQRLLEYADDLRQRDDPRADYARQQYELRQRATFTESELTELRKIYPDDLQWVNRLERSGAFCRNLCRDDLASRRYLPDQPRGTKDLNSTRFESLAPFDVDRLDSQFSWLSTEPILERREQTKADPEEMKGWSKLVDVLREQGYFVPDSFRLLIVSTDLQAKLPSNTDDYFIDARTITTQGWLTSTETNDGAIYVPFYADSQWGVVYGIRLNKVGENYCPILCGYPDEANWDEDRLDELVGSTFVVGASSIESFIYQMWLYNRAWYASKVKRAKRQLTDEETNYLRFTEANDWRRM